MAFDWKCIRHAARERPLCLTLGYNTAAFCAWLRLHGVPNVINMDGVEWRRAKWSLPARMWFWLNDWAGCWLGDHLVADHPEIKRHLATRVRGSKVTTIPYGADAVRDSPAEPVRDLGLEPGLYFTLIARPEPENSVLEIVRGFSCRRRGVRLAVLGAYLDSDPYHRAVLASASDEVCFLGAVYDRSILQSLRLHCLGYLHGHQVGGTNPSLVEALAAGNVVVAHDNPFNRWVAGVGAHYFRDVDGVDAAISAILTDPLDAQHRREQSRARHHEAFEWPPVLNDYTALLTGAAAGYGAMPRSRLPQN
jgi:glycosyltransferase involved in cell wall biosynthesis